MRRIVLILAAIAAVVAVEIVWLAPATLVGSRLESATGGALRLADTEGTIWHARGMLVTERARLPIAWDLAFWPLLRGEARVRITPYAGTAKGPPRAELSFRRGAVSVSDAELVVPVPMLAVLASVPPGWTVGGEVSFVAASFDWAPPANRGEARIVWRQARLTLPEGDTALDLGAIAANLSAQEDGLGGPIRNEGGDLDIKGELALRARGATTITLQLAPRGSAPPALAGALEALGARDGSAWRVEWHIPAR